MPIEMEKVVEIQRQARDNAATLHTYLTELQSWESEMKRKEAALNGEFDQELPPVRSKRERPIVVKKPPEKRITASDYNAWEKFDVDKACEEVDMTDVGPVSLDAKKSQQEKMEKLREEAQYEKERGNNFVKQEKWDEAIACYNRAIELVKDDAIYYANRGLCYLKKDNLHQAEADCSAALRLEPAYVKALQRRACARERLGSLRGAARDLAAVLALEPHNAPARRQLDAVTARINTKGSNSKSSPSTTPTSEVKSIASRPTSTTQLKITELPDEPRKELSSVDKWRSGVNENITVIRPVKKPPHLRSKRALKHVTIQEIPLGRTLVETQRLNITQVSNYNDTNNNDREQAAGCKERSQLPPQPLRSLAPPASSVQFMLDWKQLKGNEEARSEYLSMIEPDKLPRIFENALESEVLSQVLGTLHGGRPRFRHRLPAYLRALARVRRFAALAMFLTPHDKTMVAEMLQHCRADENLSDNELADLTNKYEL